MRSKHSNRKYTNKNRNKGKKRRQNRTLKMFLNMKMKGGADPICEQLTELKSKNIFEVFSSSIQLPKLMST